MLFCYCLAWLLLKLLLLFTDFRVKGTENIPDDKPLLIVANHLSLLDPPLLQMIIPRKLAFLAKEELFHHAVLNSFLRSRNSISVERGRNGIAVMRGARKVLAAGGTLVVFPEGMRSKNGGLQQAYHGAAALALHSGATILPVAISGSEKIKNIFTFHHPRVEVHIGKTFRIEQDCSVLTREALGKATDDIMVQIAALLPKEYRGVYSGRKENGNDSQH